MTGLTVPRASSDPGRASEVRIEAPQTGGMLAEFGARVKQIGQGLEDDFLSRQLQRAQVDLTGQMNNLRLEVSQIGDPDQAEQVYRQRVTDLRNTYLSDMPGQDGQPRLHQKNRERFGLSFDQLETAVALSVGKQTVTARQSQAEATYIEYAQTATQAAATAEPAMRDALIDQGDQQIEMLVARGSRSHAEAAKLRMDLRNGIDNARAIATVGQDPDAFLASLQSGDYAGLPADTQARYAEQARAKIAARSKADATAAEQAERERQREIGDKMSEMRGIWTKTDGRMASVDEQMLASPEFQSHPDYAETMAAYSLFQDVPLLGQATVSQLDALIAMEEARPVAHEYQTERLRVMTKLREEKDKAWRTDDVAAAREAGIGVTALPDNPVANLPGYEAALRARVTEAEYREQRGYTRSASLLDRDELAALKSAAGIDQPPETRADLARMIATLPPSRAARLEDEIGDRVLSHVGGYLAQGGDRFTAEKILRGQQVLANGNARAPSKSERLAPTVKRLGTLFGTMRGGEALQATIMDAADAHYAATRRMTPDAADDFDDATYMQSLHEVMGGTGTMGKRNARGGIIDFRGRKTALPMTVSVDDLDRAMMSLRRDLRGIRSPTYVDQTSKDVVDVAAATGTVPRPITRLTEDQARARGAQRLQNASLSGGLPGVAGQPLTEKDMAAVQMRAVGPDEYEFVYNEKPIADLQTGAPWRFSLTRLVREVAP